MIGDRARLATPVRIVGSGVGRTALAAAACLLASATIAAGFVQQSPVPAEPGLYAETPAGPVTITKVFGGVEIAGSMSVTARTRAVVFPIPALDGVPVAAAVAAFLVNLPTVQDSAAMAAQMRFMVGERVREPDFQVMTPVVGKYRTGLYRISSPQLTNDWLSAAYAKLTGSRKWRDKHPPAVVGLILNGQMYPVLIDESALTAKR